MKETNDDFTNFEREVSGCRFEKLKQWTAANAWIVITAIVMGFLLLGALLWWQSKKYSANEVFYIKTNNEFEKFVKNSSKSDANDLHSLELAMQAEPTLKSKYQAKIAQILLIDSKVEAAKSMAEETFTRTNLNQSEPLLMYAQNSLNISAEKYEEALNSSLELEKVLSDDSYSAQFETIKIFNKVRLAALYAKLKMGSEISQAVENAKLAIANSSNIKLKQQFSQGNANYIDFLNYLVKNSTNN